MNLATLQHIPAWVFVLFFVLIAFGVAQSFPRSVSLRRSTVLPLLLLGLSLMGVSSSFGAQALAFLAWAAGVAGAVALLHQRVDVSAVRFSAATQRFQMPGSWWPLALMMALFSLKFGVGMTLALHPEARASAALGLTVSAAYGLFSGLFLGRAMALWSLARRSLQMRSA